MGKRSRQMRDALHRQYNHEAKEMLGHLVRVCDGFGVSVPFHPKHTTPATMVGTRARLSRPVCSYRSFMSQDPKHLRKYIAVRAHDHPFSPSLPPPILSPDNARHVPRSPRFLPLFG